MNLKNTLLLFCLAAIWGSSFLFMRISANALGPAMLIEARVGFAALFLCAVAIITRKKLQLFRHSKHFLIIGFFNTALPFLLFAYAAQSLNASTLAVLNSTAAIWGTLIGVIWHKNKLTVRSSCGLACGLIGVGILVGWDAFKIGSDAILPFAAGIFAAFGYGIASNYAKFAPSISAFNNAHGSMWAAVLIVFPLTLFMPVREMPDLTISASVIALGVMCTGIAYLIYFHLVEQVGAASALSVTFLIPVFGILWGHLFLDEAIGWYTVVGTLMVVGGTMLVTGFSLEHLKPKKRQ